jgi:hypothetical protein
MILLNLPYFSSDSNFLGSFPNLDNPKGFIMQTKQRRILATEVYISLLFNPFELWGLLRSGRAGIWKG